jgi:hypothetical protein
MLILFPKPSYFASSFSIIIEMIPKIPLENLQLSRMICGTNQFVGITHRNNPLDNLAHAIRFRSPEIVAKYLIYLVQNHGVNCCLSSPRDKLYAAIKITENETGEKFHWLCSPSHRLTAKGLPPDIWKQIDWCVDHEVSVCLPHRDYTDNAIDKQKLIIGGNSPNNPPYPELSAYIRDKGMIPGLSSHFIETIDAVEKNSYDAPVIIQPLNKIGFESDTSPEKLITKIRSTKLQIINIKPMAAGRISHLEALPWNLQKIKPNDFLAVGFGKYQFCVEDAKMIDQLMNQ